MTAESSDDAVRLSAAVGAQGRGVERIASVVTGYRTTW